MGNVSAKKINDIFDHLDEDKSGAVTRSELESWVKDEQFMENPEFKGETVRDLSKALLEQMDKNGDGQVSREELTAYFKKLSVEEVDSLTTSLGKDKRTRVLKKVFDAIDLNKSGDVSKDELLAWMKAEKHWKEKSSTSEQDRDAVYKAIDANADAKIEFKEFEAYFTAWSVRHIREATEVLMSHVGSELEKKQNAIEQKVLLESQALAKANNKPADNTPLSPSSHGHSLLQGFVPGLDSTNVKAV
jgi:Ca2+-binding EF-hand superfamily protein